ncbi:Serine rich protein [Yersinia mollaretii]|uniref:hypothetical protein n=1 Tax=Yersinia mollaretii TaxID=33060 RepID=UPI0005DADE6D|nr:hypothetical protein [Yersinia mollaretii]CNK33925.1 Serine rich protein [Yersinia mollaretii]
MSNMSTTSSVNRWQATHKTSSPSSRSSSLVAGNLSGVSSSSGNSPLSHMKSVGEENCHCFSQNSAGGKPLPMVDGDKHIAAFCDHMSQGESSVENMAGFSRMMNQGSNSCTVTSNIQDGTKAALALFSLLPAKENRDALKSQTKPFLKAMANLSESSNSINKQKTADKTLEKFNAALFKEFGLTHNADKKNNLDGFCNQYLNQYVYPDIIDKLSQSGLVDADQLKALQNNPAQALSTLYPGLNEKNDEKIDVLKNGFLTHEGTNNKAVQLHVLIEALEHKTQIIAGIISNSLASDSPAELSDANMPESPQIASASHANMASPTTPANGANPLPSSPVNNLNPIFNNNPIINIDLNGVLDPIVRVIDRLVDKLEKVKPMDVRLSPGNMNGSAEPTRPVERTKVVAQTLNAPLESDPPTYAEAAQLQQPDNTEPKRVEQLMVKTTPNAQREVVPPADAGVGEPSRSDQTRPTPTAPLMAMPKVQKVPTSGDEIDGAPTPSTAAAQPETPAMSASKTSINSLNVQGSLVGTNGALPTYGKADAVALTNGAISGSSQSVSYRNSDTHKLAQKNSSSTAAQLVEAVKSREEHSAKAAKSVNSAGSQYRVQGGVIQSYGGSPRVALTNGAIIGSSESRRYRNSDTNLQADALKSREEQSAKTPKSVNSAGSQFMGLGSAQNRPPINFIPKKMTTEYRLNESLNSNEN